MIILKNGNIIDKNGVIIIKDVFIKEKIINGIVDPNCYDLNDYLDYQVIDCTNLLILPGFIDVHVHLREPGYSYKETIKTGTMSAAKGGITTIMAMPNLNPTPDSLDNLQVQEEIIKKDAVVNVYPIGCITEKQNGKKLANIKELAKHVKAISDDGKGVNDLDILEKAIIIAKEENILITSHAEDDLYKEAPLGEIVAVAREIELVKKHHARYHFCHLSTKESFNLIQKAQEEGYSITCEVTPHHLFLNENDIKNNPNFKMNPPLRSSCDQQATLEALLSNVATIIASDHAPHAKNDKNQEYEKCANGIIGLETMIPLVYTNLIKTGKRTIKDLINWLIINPAKTFNLPVNEISVGSNANICVIDTINEYKYTEEEILSLGKNSPFIGMKLSGFCFYTIVNGNLVYRRI